MATKKTKIDEYIKDESLNIDLVANKIFQHIYDESHHADTCTKCGSKMIDCTDEEASIYKCKDCKQSFSPRTNSLFNKVKFTNDKWIKILTCMLSDFTLEDTVKVVQANAETIKRKWALIYSGVNWDRYNILVREKPTKNIYADFEVIIN